MKRITANPYLDGMMGLVVGDALGVPVEFVSGEELSKKPVTGISFFVTYNVLQLGGGNFGGIARGHYS